MRPAADILDGAHSGGNAHFYFLPPMVPQPAYNGISDGTKSPTVKVCVWVATPAPGSCGTIIAIFGMTSGTASQTIRYDATAQQYIVNWQTDQCTTGPCVLDVQAVYRVRILVGVQELGHADVQIVNNGSQLKNVQTGDYIGLVDGRTMPVKFRIEQGAVSIVAPGAPAAVASDGGVVESSDGQTAVAVPAGALSTSTNITIQPATNPPAGVESFSQPVDFGPTGTTFSTPVTLTLVFDPTKLPSGVPATQLGVYTAADDGSWQFVPNSSVNVADNTVSAPVSHFSTYVLKVTPNAASLSSTGVTISLGPQTTPIATANFVFQPDVGSSIPVYQAQVAWRIANPGIAVFTTPSGPQSVWYSITDVNGNAVAPAISGSSFGTTTVTATIGSYTSSLSLAVAPKISWVKRPMAVAPNQIVFLVAQLPSPAPPNLIVSVTSSDPTVATVSPQQFIMSAGQQFVSGPSGPPIVAAVAPGQTTITVSAPGFASDNLVVTSGGTGQLVVQLPSTLPLGILSGVGVTVLAPDGSQAGVNHDETFGIAATNLAVFDILGHPISSLTIPAGTSGVGIQVKPSSTGPASLQLSDALYGKAFYTTQVVPITARVNVTAASSSFLIGQSTQFTATPFDASGNIVQNVPCSWSTSNANVAQVSSTGVVSAVAAGAVTISANCQGIIGGLPVTVTNWYALRDLPSARWGHAMVTDGSRIYAIGGAGPPTSAFGAQSRLDMFDPATNSWSSLPSMPAALGYSNVAYFAGTIYVFGGWTCNLCASRSAYAFDTRLQTWTQLPDLPSPTYGGIARVIAGKIFMTTGTCCGSPGAMQMFDPLTNTYTRLASPPRNHDFPAGGGVIGGKLYVAGGEGAGGAVDAYDPATNTWSSVASMSVLRQHGGGAIIDGKLFIVDGTETGSGTDALDVLVFDPASGWSTQNRSPEARNLPGAVLLGARFYVSGGTTTDATTVLSSFEGLPTSGAPQPVASVQVVSNLAMNHLVAGRTQQFSTALFDGNSAPLGGRVVQWSSSNPTIATVDASGVVAGINVGTTTITATSEGVVGSVNVTIDSPWSTAAAAPASRRSNGVASLNGLVYNVGGYNGNYMASVDAYDPAHDVWQSVAPMAFARIQAAVSAGSNVLYSVGGFNPAFAGGANASDGTLATLEVYDATSNSWSTKTPMTTPRRYPTANFVNGILYVIGGATTGNATPTGTVEAYDPLTGTWTTKTSMPTPRFGAASTVINGKIYVVGGFDSKSLAVVEVYDPATDTWTTRSSMSTARYGFALGVVNGLAYAAAGNFNGPVLNSVEVYNPVTDRWMAMSVGIPTARSDMGGAVVGNRFFVIGGTTLNSAADWLSVNEVMTP